MSLTIIELEVRNVKGIRAVQIDADGKPVIHITGKNRQGKTSVLDAIWAALKGGEFSRESTSPLRDGELRGSVKLHLGSPDGADDELIVTRTWKKGGPKGGELVLTSANGTKISSPQGALDALLGRFAFDPVKFADETESEQVDTLLSAIELPFDPYELARERAVVFDERAAANKELKALDAQVTALPVFPRSVPTERVSTQSLLDELRALQEHNASVDAAEDKLTVTSTAVDDKKTSVENANLLVEELIAKLQQARLETARCVEAYDVAVAANAAQQTAVAALERKSLDDVNARLAGLDDTNAQIDAKIKGKALTAQFVEQQDRVDKLNAKLDDLDAKKRDGIAAAEMPLPGLSFDAEVGVTLNGTPFKDLSSREQLIVSTSLAMAQNPTLRVLRIDRGESLDSDGIKVISELAVEHDYQLWIASVRETPQDDDIVIFDGEVVE